MIRLDGDRHRRVRDAFGGLFTARRVERYRAIIAGRAAALIDQAAAAGSMDLVTGFARPLPFTVINDVLGVPPEDRDWLGAALASLNLGFARQRDSDRTPVQGANDAAEQMLSYFAELLDQRVAAPADDLMTALAARHADGEDRQDLLANCIFFVLAGHQTTTTLLTLGTHLLCTHPSAVAALQEDPALARGGGGNAAADHRRPSPEQPPGPTLTSTALPARPGSRGSCSWPPPTATLPPSRPRPIPHQPRTRSYRSFAAGAHSASVPPSPDSTANSR